MCEGNVKISIAPASITVPYILADLRKFGLLGESNHKPPRRPRTLQVHTSSRYYLVEEPWQGSATANDRRGTWPTSTSQEALDGSEPGKQATSAPVLFSIKAVLHQFNRYQPAF